MSFILTPVTDMEQTERYLEDCLHEGNALSQLIATNYRNWEGRGFLLLPENIASILRLPRNYRYGGVCQRNQALKSLAVLMFNEVLLHQQSVVFEHALAAKGDPFLAKLPHNPIYYESEVYFIFNHEKAALQSLIQLIANSSTAQGFTAFLVPENSVKITNDGTLQQIGQIAEAVKTIVIGVFDNETFLFWQHDK